MVPKYNLPGVNALFDALVNNEDFHELDFSQLKLAIGGGMAVQKNVAEKWKNNWYMPAVRLWNKRVFSSR